MKKEQKLFAFKLADKTNSAPSKNKQKWSARSGVAIAGCTDPTGWGDYRYDSIHGGWDNGVYC